VWLRRIFGVFAIVCLSGALVELYLLLRPVRPQLIVDLGSYDPALVTPGATAGLTAEELTTALPNLTVSSLRSGPGLLTNSWSGASIVFVDAVMLSGADGPFIADDQSRPDATNLRDQPLAKGDDRPKSASAWLAPILDGAASRPTLLVLDLSRPRVNWRSGVLAPFATFEFLEDLRREVESRTKKSPTTRLAVLVACRPGEQAWSEDGRSRFSTSLIEALNGAADGAKDGRTDGRVTAAELGHYVCNDVQTWVSSHRDEEGQHPIWMTFGADFDVAYASGEAVRWPSAPTGRQGLADKIDEAWSRRDAVWTGPPATRAYRDHPLDWRRANYLLLQVEACWRAGQLQQASRLLADANDSLNRLALAQPVSFDPPVAASDQLASFEQALPPSVSAAELQKSVQVRSAAQRAATLSPRALGLVRSALLQADAARREAEDALFTGNNEMLQQRRDEAARLYQTCLDAAERYESASRAIDRLMAGLPHLADWAAAQGISDRLIDAFAVTPAEIGDVDLSDRGIELVASLLVDARSLRQALAELERGGVPLDEMSRQLDIVANQAADAVRKMDEFDQSLRDDAKELLKTSEKTGARRLIRRGQLEDSLANCLLDANTRRRILSELADLDDGLNSSVIGKATGDSQSRESTGMANFGWQPGHVSQNLARLAAWQGLWALLVRSLDPASDSDSERLWKDNWAVIATQARLDEAQRPSDAETARKTASSLGDLLRIGWKASSAEASRIRSYTADTDEITRELVARDRVARSLPGFDADTVIRSRRRDPASELAAWNNSQLSLYLAKQSLDDFYAGQPGGMHWFETASRFHLDAASRSSGGASAVSRELSVVRDLLSKRRSTQFWVQTDRVVFGSYDKRSSLLSVATKGDPPPGSMAVWLEPSKSNSAVQLASPERQVVKIDPSNLDEVANISIVLLRNAPSCDLVLLPARLFYRGHMGAEASAVEANPCPPGQRTVVAMPQPERGTVIVSGTDRRSILFVLDCSKSMLDALPGGTSKMFTAKSILQDAVAKLQREAGASPRRIGFVAFGHRMNRRGNGDLWPNPNWPANDLPADPLADYEVLVPLRGAAAVDPLLFPKQIQRIDAWGMTPLVNAVRFAVSQFRSEEPGTLVVITDGADSALEKGPDALRADTRAVLKELSATLATRRSQGSAVEVHIVGFALDDASKKLLKEVFDAVAIPSGGRQFAAEDGDKLKTFLADAVEPRKYSVLAAGRNDGPEFDLGSGSTDLARGEYRIVFPDAEPAPITISGGERVVFDLQDGRLVPRKYQWGSAPGQVARATGAVTDPDVPNVLVDRGYRINSGKATLLVSLDRASADMKPTEGYIERPQEVWFEATDSSGRRVADLTWQIAERYDVSTWMLNLPAPSDQKLDVTAHWKRKATAPTPALILSRTEIGKEVTVTTRAGSASLVLKSVARDGERPGIVVARFEPAGGKPPTDDVRAALEDTWAQIDPGPPGAGDFRPIEAQTQRTFFFEDGAIEFAFSAGPDFDVASARVGLIEPAARQMGAAVAGIHYGKAD
jgi:hypothetical protein